MFLTLHDTLLTTRGRRAFIVYIVSVFFFVISSNVGDTVLFLRSAPNVNVVRISKTREQTAGVTMTL